MPETRSNTSTTRSGYRRLSPPSTTVTRKRATSSVGAGTKEKKVKKDDPAAELTKGGPGGVKETAGKGKKEQR